MVWQHDSQTLGVGMANGRDTCCEILRVKNMYAALKLSQTTILKQHATDQMERVTARRKGLDNDFSQKTRRRCTR